MFGLGFATVLTLVVAPSLYVMLSRFSLRLGFKGVLAEHPVAKPETAYRQEM